MLKNLLSAATALVTAGTIATSAIAADCANETMKRIMERGSVIMGVKADYKPWGFRDPNGDIVGMEVDMARDVAQSLGVELELVAVQSSNRMEFLQQGKVDMFIATMSDRSDRRREVGIPDPDYYTSGTNVLAREGAVSTWEDLRGKPVCGKQGDGRCVAWVYDDSSIMSDLSSGEWEGYEMPLTSEDDTPWGLAVPLAERECALGRFMSGMTYWWHASGRLIELESKWGIQQTQFLQDQHEKFAYEHDHLSE
jgi:polar amino acid transport system substrate-binding protein